MRYIANVSFGKDSLAMLFYLVAKKWPLDEVVYYNNGMEFDAIYQTRDAVLPLLEAWGIKYTELTPERPFLFDMLERKIKYRDKPGYHYGYEWCGGPCRWGTAEKLRALRAYGGDAIQYVGLAADEEHRFAKAAYPTRSLPLVTWGKTEADCLAYCYSLGFKWLEDSILGPVPLYELLDRVSCWCCSNKNLKELKNIYLYLPRYWTRLKGLQSKLSRPMKGYYKGQSKGVFELEERFRNELLEDANADKRSQSVHTPKRQERTR